MPVRTLRTRRAGTARRDQASMTLECLLHLRDLLGWALPPLCELLGRYASSVICHGLSVDAPHMRALETRLSPRLSRMTFIKGAA